MGKYNVEHMQTSSPGCLLVPQHRVIMEQWHFSHMGLSNKTAENHSSKSTSKSQARKQDSRRIEL